MRREKIMWWLESHEVHDVSLVRPQDPWVLTVVGCIIEHLMGDLVAELETDHHLNASDVSAYLALSDRERRSFIEVRQEAWAVAVEAALGVLFDVSPIELQVDCELNTGDLDLGYMDGSPNYKATIHMYFKIQYYGPFGVAAPLENAPWRFPAL